MDPESITDTVEPGGAEIPRLGFGTARMVGETCRGAVRAALEIGYRHVDTAQLYDNEDAVGAAIEASDVPREQLFVVTKLAPANLAYDDVLDSTEGSLERLGLSTLDLLLIHAPREHTPLSETIGAMNELQEEGLVEHVGVSNFSTGQLEEAIAVSETPIVTNQVKYHPYYHQDDLLRFCIENDVCLTAYAPLAEGAVVGDERLESIGERAGKSAGQVALRWLIQQPSVSAIPKSARHRHLRANADLFDFELTDEEMRTVFEIGGDLSESLAPHLDL